MSNHPYRHNEIDLLRGIACISVVAFHYLSRGPRAGWMADATFPWADSIARYGFLGVQLFFMISGFVILLSAQGATPRSFVASRVARLYPAFWVAASITATAVWLAGDMRFSVTGVDYLVNLTMFASWFGVPWIDGAYWSLAVELLFYIYVWLALRLGVFDRIEWLLALWLLVSAVNAVRPMWPVEVLLNARWAPFFVAGSLFFIVRLRGLTIPRAGLLAVSYGLALFYALDEAARYGRGISPVDLLPSVVAAAITCFFGLFAAIALKRWSIQRSATIAWLGVLTYPVYLLHQNLGYVVFGYLHRWMGNPLVCLAVTSAFVLALALLVHRGFEKKMGPMLRQILK